MRGFEEKDQGNKCVFLNQNLKTHLSAWHLSSVFLSSGTFTVIYEVFTVYLWILIVFILLSFNFVIFYLIISLHLNCLF